MKDENGGVAIEELVGLKLKMYSFPKMHSFLVGNSEHKKAKGMNKNVVVTISRAEYNIKTFC